MVASPHISHLPPADFEHLEPLGTEQVREEGTYDSLAITQSGHDVIEARTGSATDHATAASDLAWRRSSFLACTLENITASRIDLRESRAVSSKMINIAATSVEAQGLSLQRCHITRARAGAVTAYESVLRDIVVEGCKIDYLNLRSARLRDVRFVDCVIGELDAVGADLTRVEFASTSIRTVTLQRATLTDVDFRGAHLSEIVTVADLKGATLTPDQIAQLSSAFAAHLGIREEQGPQLSSSAAA